MQKSSSLLNFNVSEVSKFTKEVTIYVTTIMNVCDQQTNKSFQYKGYFNTFDFILTKSFNQGLHRELQGKNV